MPRIRTIKPEFWDSPDTARAGLRARLLYIAMWNWADDYGVGEANHKRLISFAFPNDDITAAEVPTLVAEVSRCFGAVFYTYEGRPFYYIPEWEKHQRTEKKAKQRTPFPTALDPNNGAEVESSDDSGGNSATWFESPDAGTGEQGKKEIGTGEQGKVAARDDVTSLCMLLADQIEANGSKRPTITQAWLDAARLMLDRDKRDFAKTQRLIVWCQNDSFWQSNVLSMSSFRSKYDKLRLQANREATGGKPTPMQRVERTLSLATDIDTKEIA